MNQGRKFAAFVFSSLMLVAIALALCSPPRAEAQSSTTGMFTKQIKWATITPDSEFIQDENDTTYTQPVIMDDWDPRVAQNGTTAGSVINLYLVVSRAGVFPVATDTVYGNVGLSADGVIFHGSRTLGSGTINFLRIGDTDRERVWRATVPYDADTPGATNVYGCKAWRLRIAGDQSGTNPVFPAAKLYVTYPKRPGTGG